MKQNVRFGLVLGQLVVLKTAQPNLLLATFEGSFVMFFGQKIIYLKKKYCSVRTKKLHRIKV